MDTALVVLGGTMLFGWSMAELLGPFRLTGVERQKAIGWRASLKSWGRGWLRRPRERLSTNDWLGKGGRMPVPVLTTVGFLLGGAHLLFGQHQHFRLGGALATSSGLATLALIVGHVRRPAKPSQVDPDEWSLGRERITSSEHGDRAAEQAWTEHRRRGDGTVDW